LDHQRVNHFRNHYELTRKDLLAGLDTTTFSPRFLPSLPKSFGVFAKQSSATPSRGETGCSTSPRPTLRRRARCPSPSRLSPSHEHYPSQRSKPNQNTTPPLLDTTPCFWTFGNSNLLAAVDDSQHMDGPRNQPDPPGVAALPAGQEPQAHEESVREGRPAGGGGAVRLLPADVRAARGGGLYELTLSLRKAPAWFQPLNLNVVSWFQAFDFTCNLCRYTADYNLFVEEFKRTGRVGGHFSPTLFCSSQGTN
jgi:hypothetical protein